MKVCCVWLAKELSSYSETHRKPKSWPVLGQAFFRRIEIRSNETGKNLGFKFNVLGIGFQIEFKMNVSVVAVRRAFVTTHNYTHKNLS